MKRELQPTKIKAHGGIISDINPLCNDVFCTIGMEHRAILEDIGVDYIVLEDINALTTAPEHQIRELRLDLIGKNLFFLTTSTQDYCLLHRDIKHFFDDVVEPYIIDLEVMRAYELIPCEEISLNEFEMGLELPNGCTLKEYVDLVREENLHGEFSSNSFRKVYDYVKKLLQNEAKRLSNIEE